MSQGNRSSDCSMEIPLEVIDELGRVIDRIRVRPVPEPTAPGDATGYPSRRDTGPHRL
jgi:hypothetical protein